MFVCILAIMDSFSLIAQSSDSCINSNHICFNEGSYMFPAGVGSGTFGNNVACLYTTPNPQWFCFQVLQPGRLNISLSSNPEHDLDFVCWGPFSADNYTELIGSGVCSQLNLDSTGCVSHESSAGPNPVDFGAYPIGNIVDCGFSSSSTEYIHIPNMVANEWYMIMVTNYSNQPCTIWMAGDPTSTGSSNCLLNPPLLTVNADSLSNFSYFYEHGPSACQMFTVDGNYLVPNDSFKIFITAPEHYEVSFIPDTNYSDTIYIDNYFSMISQYQVYVRLKEGLSIGDYFSELITISGGGADSVMINCNGSVVEDNGIEESGKSHFFTLSPNPASDVLNCNFENKNNRKLSIVDVTGKTIASWESNLPNEIIDIKAYANGVYFLKVEEENRSYSRKFIIRRD
jgi:hypothetical protein